MCPFLTYPPPQKISPHPFSLTCSWLFIAVTLSASSPRATCDCDAACPAASSFPDFLLPRSFCLLMLLLLCCPAFSWRHCFYKLLQTELSSERPIPAHQVSFWRPFFLFFPLQSGNFFRLLSRLGACWRFESHERLVCGSSKLNMHVGWDKDGLGDHESFKMMYSIILRNYLLQS